VHGVSFQLLNITNLFQQLQLADGQDKKVVELGIKSCQDQMNLVQQQLEIAEKENDQPFITAMQRFLWSGRKQVENLVASMAKFNEDFPVIAKCVAVACVLLCFLAVVHPA